MMSFRFLLPLVGLSTLFLSACMVNPVTGDTELSFTSQARELQIGQEQYSPSQQSQGGVYYLDPDLSFYVSSIGRRLAAASDRPQLPYEFVILNNSVPNAWALPGGKIALNRGLLTQLDNEAELAAVLAHEIVHAAARHSAQQLDKNLLLGAGMQVLAIGLGNQAGSDLILQGAGLGAALIQSKYGRGDELEADAYGMQYMSRAGYDPNGAVTLQETFLRLSQGSQEGRQDWLSGLFASHPPSAERVTTNRATAVNLPAGQLNKKAFQEKMAKLRHDGPAYKAYDDGMKALRDENPEKALALSKQAITRQSQESLFHELKGLSLKDLDKSQQALAAFNQAIALNKHYFRHYLYRGLLHKERNNPQQAKQDLTASYQMLPTAIAAYNLGELALEAGDTATALRYFEPVAQGSGELAQSAEIQIARLQLAQAPGKYIRAGVNRNAQGYLVIAVQNLAPLTVRDITISLQKMSGYQALELKQIRINGPLSPRQQSSWVKTGVSSSEEELRLYRATIKSAAVAE